MGTVASATGPGDVVDRRPQRHGAAALEVFQQPRFVGDIDADNRSGVGTGPFGRAEQQLRAESGGDIVVLASSSVIRNLVAAGELDRLIITLCPELVGGGARLFEDGVPATSWSLTDLSTTDSGAIVLVYDKVA
ncbi:dihydrofolate reductase family protein [Nocardia sp. CA-135953]|uniref:dihydrofolate reductase family protein n=1 Tax=Nocardia sp. CA-135953 TaxID=3239978 RepID=UPI003D973AA4